MLTSMWKITKLWSTKTPGMSDFQDGYFSIERHLLYPNSDDKTHKLLANDNFYILFGSIHCLYDN